MRGGKGNGYLGGLLKHSFLSVLYLLSSDGGGKRKGGRGGQVIYFGRDECAVGLQGGVAGPSLFFFNFEARGVCPCVGC